jgi:hypothetical protein
MDTSTETMSSTESQDMDPETITSEDSWSEEPRSPRPPKESGIPTAIDRTWLGRGVGFEGRMVYMSVAGLTNDPDWEDLERIRKDQTHVQKVLSEHGANHNIEVVLIILEQMAEDHKTLGYFTLFDHDLCVPVADRAFPASIDTALKDFARRNTTSRKEDWQARLIDRPGAAEPEIWGVHAYLDPMTMLADNCRTETLDKGETVDSSRPWDSMGKGTIYNTGLAISLDEDFQRLPSQVEIRDGHAKITTYVNGLHPWESAMLATFEEMIDRILPMWQRCIDSTFSRHELVLDPEDDLKLVYEPCTPLPRPDKMDLLSPDSDLQVIIQGETIDSDTELGGVFPDSFVHSRGWWRSAGNPGENVCAVAIYCYDMHPDAHLSLRLQEPVDTSYLELALSDLAVGERHLVHLYAAMLRNLDLRNWEAGTAELFDASGSEDLPGDNDEDDRPSGLFGAIRLRPGRLITFPAALFYRLRIHGRPRRCGLLTMFLVDPNRPVLSTARVPPQSRDWILPQIRVMPWFARLPEETWQHICSYVPWAWTDQDDHDDPSDGRVVRKWRDYARDAEAIRMENFLNEQETVGEIMSVLAYSTHTEIARKVTNVYRTLLRSGKAMILILILTMAARMMRARQVRASITSMLCRRPSTTIAHPMDRPRKPWSQQNQLGTLDAPYSTSISRPLWLRGFLMRRICWAVPQALVCPLMQASPVWLSRGWMDWAWSRCLLDTLIVALVQLPPFC